MKFLALELLRFGHFTDHRLDFAAGTADLHIIFGSNEAGKSTTLRAVSGLLFGIPETTRDHHRHEAKELRIGARLRNQAGEQLQLIRRKGRKKTLLDPSEQPLDEAVLRRFLGGLSRELFEAMFGLSHDRLVQGGQDLLAGKGELGESLFGAGLGVRGLPALRAELDAAAGKIFAPRAQNPPLNKAIKSYEETRRQINQLALKPGEWKKLQKELQQAEAHLAEREREHSATTAELQRLERSKRVLPRIHERTECLARLQALGEVTRVPESCAQERTQAQQQLAHAAAQLRKLQEEQARCEQERAALPLPEPLLARAMAVEQMQKSLGAHLKAQQDLPGLQANVMTAQAEIQRLLRELGRSETPAQAATLQIDLATQKRIRRLGQDGARLETEWQRARRDIEQAESRQCALRQELDALPPECDPETLARTVAEIRKRGDLEDRLREMTLDCAGLQEKASAQLAALTLWQGSLAEIARLPLPPVETVERLRAAFEELQFERRDWQKQQTQTSERLAAVQTQIARLEGQGAVPTESDWHQACAERDALWQQLRAQWSADTLTALAERFEAQVRAADEIAERLWRDADRVAKHAELQAERQRRQSEGEEIMQQLAHLERRTSALEQQWRALWQPAGIEPLPPAEMRSWLSRHEKLVTLSEQCQTQERQRAALAQELAELCRRCRRELDKLAAAADPEATLSTLLAQADAVIAAIEATRQTRRQLQQELARIEREAQERRQSLARCQQEQSQWREQWGAAVHLLGLSAAAGADEAEALLDGFAELSQKQKECQDYQIRIDHIGRDAEQFAVQVAELAKTCAPDLLDKPAVEAAEALIQRLKEGKDNRKDRDNLDKRLKQIAQELENQQQAQAAAQAVLDRLLQEAGVTTLEALEAAERQSRDWRTATASVQELDKILLAEGLPLDELIAQVRAIDPDTLDADIPRLEDQNKRLQQECDRSRETVWQLRHTLEALDGRSQAAEAAAEAQQILAEIKTQVENYARLKLSALLLGREIERYRERHQGPIVSRAGELLQRMTLGSFRELSVGIGEGDKTVLLCVRADGQRVPVEGLSDGARDQLYLALRLASLEQNGLQPEPTPLVVDDILINFDDQRAQATLALLGELSRQTQILFFTHHRRLVELAQAAMPDGRVKTHYLDETGLN